MVLMAIGKTITRMVTHVFRRGKGLFKILFAIDDFIRLFTMTILLPIFFTWLNLGPTGRVIGVILGMIIDVHDFITEFGQGKTPLQQR